MEVEVRLRAAGNPDTGSRDADRRREKPDGDRCISNVIYIYIISCLNVSETISGGLTTNTELQTVPLIPLSSSFKRSSGTLQAVLIET